MSKGGTDELESEEQLRRLHCCSMHLAAAEVGFDGSHWECGQEMSMSHIFGTDMSVFDDQGRRHTRSADFRVSKMDLGPTKIGGGLPAP